MDWTTFRMSSSSPAGTVSTLSAYGRYLAAPMVFGSPPHLFPACSVIS